MQIITTHEKILSKRYDRLNICPGFTIKFSWDGQTAIELDRENKFEKDFYEKTDGSIRCVRRSVIVRLCVELPLERF